MRTTILILAACLLSASAFGGAHESAGSDAQQVRVAGGTMLEHAPSSKSDADWAKQRPDFERLKPKKRGKD